jgi:hypothetical protein
LFWPRNLHLLASALPSRTPASRQSRRPPKPGQPADLSKLAGPLSAVLRRFARRTWEARVSHDEAIGSGEAQEVVTPGSYRDVCARWPADGRPGWFRLPGRCPLAPTVATPGRLAFASGRRPVLAADDLGAIRSTLVVPDRTYPPEKPAGSPEPITGGSPGRGARPGRAGSFRGSRLWEGGREGSVSAAASHLYGKGAA